MYQFYGAETPAVTPVTEEYKSIADQRQLYDLLKKVWSADT